MEAHALLFTDLVDSTAVVERLGDARAASVLAEHDRIARALLSQHGGREIDHSDGFFLLFEDPVRAAAFALDYHAALDVLGLRSRAGLHVGPVTLRENPADDVARGAKPIEVEGIAKPLAARVMSLARGGQTLLTQAARAALGGALADGALVEAHGHYRLKGIAEPVEIFEIGVRDRSSFVPPEDTEKAFRVVRGEDGWRPVREVRHNLPRERDAFVGRSADLASVATRLDSGARLLTVLGPAGTGKTRLARRYGWTWLGDWPGGVYFCDLSDARTLESVFFVVALALDVPLGKDDPAVQLGRAISTRGRCLLILDNFEQIVPHAEASVGRWLDRAADAAFLVTSRERLHLAGEEVLPLEPLSVDAEGVELFAMRARTQKADFALTPDNRATVARVVALLDGLPLAIELAAARIHVLSPAQLLERLTDRFALLAGARSAADRQATLRGAIDWSWNLLLPWEQSALAQCSVFEGGFTLDAAEAVLDLASWTDAPSIVDASPDARRQEPVAHLGAGRSDAPRARRAVLRDVPDDPRVRGREAGDERRRRATRCAGTAWQALRPLRLRRTPADPLPARRRRAPARLDARARQSRRRVQARGRARGRRDRGRHPARGLGGRHDTRPLRLWRSTWACRSTACSRSSRRSARQR
jgi:class 3 adenylate cyclase